MSGVDFISTPITPPASAPKAVINVASPAKANADPTPAPAPKNPVTETQQASTEASVTAGTNLQIIRDDKSGRYVYKFLDRQTGQVKDQFPREYVLRELAYLREQNGKVVDATA